jgi:hypothetical protein
MPSGLHVLTNPINPVMFGGAVGKDTVSGTPGTSARYPTSRSSALFLMARSCAFVSTGGINQCNDSEAAQKLGRGQRQRHADRALGFSLTGGKRFEGGPIGMRQFIKPAMGVAKRFDKSGPRSYSHRTDRRGSLAFALNDLAAPVGRWRHPENSQDAILASGRRAFAEIA